MGCVPAGCASVAPGNTAKTATASGWAAGANCTIVAGRSPFYRYGPAQAFGADFHLAKGDAVVLIRKGFGFSRVQTDAGVTGYVPTEDLELDPDFYATGRKAVPDSWSGGDRLPVLPALGEAAGEPGGPGASPELPRWDAGGLPQPPSDERDDRVLKP
jgi:hypothetical protein